MSSRQRVGIRSLSRAARFRVRGNGSFGARFLLGMSRVDTLRTLESTFTLSNVPYQMLASSGNSLSSKPVSILHLAYNLGVHTLSSVLLGCAC